VRPSHNVFSAYGTAAGAPCSRDYCGQLAGNRLTDEAESIRRKRRQIVISGTVSQWQHSRDGVRHNSALKRPAGPTNL